MTFKAAIILMLAPALLEAAPQREADTYTRYELLAPATHKFRITYEVTATTPGATAYYNPIRPGSIASDERVFDRATGKPLHFEEVGGHIALAAGVEGAKSEDRFIKVTLARPVAPGGGGRILIDKTYEDARSYHLVGDAIEFDRPLGIKRNAVVLPPGYELVALNYPSQVLQQADGRIAVAFWNDAPGQAPLVLRARAAKIGAGISSLAASLDERAHQSRNIIYDLKQPETHSFALTHDYTETRPGTATYVNVVRPGSTVSNPGASDLDTGETLSAETVRGAAVKAVEPAMDVGPDSVAVVFRFPPVQPGETRRLRIAETYTDPARYLLTGNELVWHRSLGRADNVVILPAGWLLTNSSVPATLTMTGDDRVRLSFINPRTDEIDVIITALRRAK